MNWGRSGSNAVQATGPIARGEYVSALFEEFCRAQERHAPATILDLGPSTPSNVVYWAGQGHRATALDVLRRSDAATDAVADPPRLEYRDDRFTGILCWTVLSHLGPREALRFAGEIERVLRPGGNAFAIFDGTGSAPPPAVRYRILGRDRLGFEPVDREPPRAVTTSEIERLLANFKPCRFAVMRHGSREALGTYPPRADRA